MESSEWNNLKGEICDHVEAGGLLREERTGQSVVARGFVVKLITFSLHRVVYL